MGLWLLDRLERTYWRERWSYPGRTVLIVGMAGFLGMAVCRALDEQRRNRRSFEEYVEEFREVPVDSDVVDCSADLNTDSLHARVALAKGRARRYVYLSSVAVTHALGKGPWTDYSERKYEGECHAREQGATILRLPTIYGGVGGRSWPVQALKAWLVGSSVREMRSRQWAVSQIMAALEA